MYSIFLGVQDITNLTDGHAQVYSVSRVQAHESYDTFNVLNDIAIIKLAEKVSFSHQVQTACLPDRRASGFPTAVNTDVYVNGWGDVFGNETYPAILQNVKLTLYDSSACSRVLAQLSKNWNTQICAGKK